MDVRQLEFRFGEMISEQQKTQELLHTMAQSIAAASKQAQEDNDNLIQALDDLRDQIRSLTDVMAEANGIWR